MFNGSLLLHEWVKNPRKFTYEQVFKMIVSGLDIDYVDAVTGMTPVYLAVQKSNLNVVRFLVDVGADMKVKGRLDGTALHLAVENLKNPEIIQYLIDQGVPVDAENKIGYTALHYAVKESNLEGCKILLKNGANLTPLRLALGLFERWETNWRQSTCDMFERKMLSMLHIVQLFIRQFALKNNPKLKIEHDALRMITLEEASIRYYDSCIKELSRLKYLRFYNELSLYDIFEMDRHKLSGYCRNEDCINAFNNVSVSLFPIYYPELMEKFYAEVEHQKNFKTVACFLSEVFCLCDVVIRTIVDFMQYEEIEIISGLLAVDHK